MSVGRSWRERGKRDGGVEADGGVVLGYATFPFLGRGLFPSRTMSSGT